MKTIKQGDVIMRKSNDEAIVLVKSGWAYCPKKEWKASVRDKDKKAVQKEVGSDNVKKTNRSDNGSKYKAKKNKKIDNTVESNNTVENKV